jgi:hypothetical protein
MFGSSTDADISCHLILCQMQLDHGKGEAATAYEMKLQTARRLAWDTCKESFDSVMLKGPSQLSYVSLHCTATSALLLAEARIVDMAGRGREISGWAESSDDVPRRALPALQSFSTRWAVGGMLASEIKAIFGSYIDFN